MVTEASGVHHPVFSHSASGVFQGVVIPRPRATRGNKTPKEIREPLVTTRNLPRPPVPAGSAWNHTWRFVTNPMAFLADARAECGDLFRLRLIGLGDWVFLCSPELLQEMYKVPAKVLSAGEVNQGLLGSLLGDRALLSLEDEPHRQRRRVIFPLFNGEKVYEHTDTVRRLTVEMISRWRDDHPIQLLAELDQLVLRSMLAALFGDIGDSRLDDLCNTMQAYFLKGLRSKLVMMPALQVDLGPWSPWGRVQHLRRRMETTVRRELEACRRGEGGGGLVEDLMAASQDDGHQLDDTELLHEICTLAFGACESSPKLLSWTILGLLENPEVLDRLRAELSEKLEGCPIDASKLDRLEYLEAVLYEGMRHRPSTSTAGIRLARQPLVLGGHRISKGTLLTQCLSELGHREDLFASPERFEPEHFYRRNHGNLWKPFGGGTRKCAGEGFALMSMKVILATLVERLDLALADTQVESERMGFFMVPKGGGRVRLVRRWAWGERPASEVEFSTPTRQASRAPSTTTEPSLEEAVPSRCPFHFLHR